MLLSSATSLGSSEPMSSRVDIIEISDDEDESIAYSGSLANGTHRRQAELIQGNDFVKVSPDSKISNAHQRIRLKTSLTMPVAYSPGRDGGDNLLPNLAPVVAGRIADENNSLSSCYPKRRMDRSLKNGWDASFATKSENRCESTVDFTSCRSSRYSTEVTRYMDEAAADKESLCANATNNHASIEGESACKTDSDVMFGLDSTLTGGNSRSPKKFLKPPSPKVALSKKAFFSMLLEDVDDLITKYGSHLIKNITVKDITGKGIDEIRLPKNLKVTPQLQKKRQFMEPISADDEVIVISDDETPADNACPETLTDSISESARHTIKSEYQAKENFLANLQLFHRIKLKKPMKKDITNVLKTRNNMKAYIANPHVSLVKANCIYKYVTNKGILSPEQFRARREPPRRKRKAAGRTSKPRRSHSRSSQPPAPKRRISAPPALEFRRSLRKRAVRIANQPQRFSRRFLTSALKQEIGRHELNRVWTAYSPLEVTRYLHVPVVVLNRLESSSPPVSVSVSGGPILKAARPKEYKCKWCPFHSLNTPSLREHCFEFHGRIFPLVIG